MVRYRRARIPGAPHFFAVTVPDHAHMLWTLPEGDADFPGRWRSIKAGFSRELVRHGIPLIRDHRGEYDVWQRRYGDHLIRETPTSRTTLPTFTTTR